jgi:transcriptional regulator with XRE-family HTH domain
MPPVTTVKRDATLGCQARRLRVADGLTMRELAELADVPAEHVMLFESNLPVPLDSKRRILKELWGRKYRK